nr:hypothetical protein [Allomuricauda sp.]
MKMVHTYEEFCKYHDVGMVKPDVSTPLGYQSVQALRKMGWRIEGKNFLGFRSSARVAKELLDICRKSQENFETAYRHAGIDFWVD